MKNKRILVGLLAASLLCPLAASASAPTSQFYYKGWPYKVTAPCNAVATATPLPTAVPTTAPTSAPTSAPTTAPTTAPTSKPTTAPSGNASSYSPSAQELELLSLLNEDRAANGLGALTLDTQLCYYAHLKSVDMRDNNYFAHESPTYGRASEMLTRFGYSYSGVGENIAHHATVEKAEAAFLSSEGHRRNIMGSQWTKVGLGVCYDANGYVYVTQIFVR